MSTNDIKFGGCPSCGRADCIAMSCRQPGEAKPAPQPVAKLIGQIEAILYDAQKLHFDLPLEQMLDAQEAAVYLQKAHFALMKVERARRAIKPWTGKPPAIAQGEAVEYRLRTGVGIVGTRIVDVGTPETSRKAPKA